MEQNKNMERNKNKLENFETITNWLRDTNEKYKDQSNIVKNAVLFQQCFENPNTLLKLVAKTHHMPKKIRKLFIKADKSNKFALIDILADTGVMKESKADSLKIFLDFYFEGENWVEQVLRHYEATIQAFKSFDFNDNDKQEFIVNLYTDYKFYYYQVFGEIGVDEQTTEKLIEIKTKDKMLRFLSIIPTVLKNNPNLFYTVENYALNYPPEENDTWEQFGYNDSKDIEKELKNEWK